MNCPVDNTQLMMTERQGIEIDYCPQCRGVWLDRGELDKLIERGDRDDDDDDRRRDFDRRDDDRRREFDRRDDDRWQDRDRDRDYAPSQYRPKRKKGFLSEMFEFGD